MRQVETQLDRYLVLLGNKIRQRGFTQLEVQQALGWGRSYISQLMTKQKSLRMEQVLLILNVIGVEPAEYFAELHRLPGARYGTARSAPPAATGEETDGDAQEFQKLKALLEGLVALLVDNQVINGEQLRVAVEAAERESY